MIYLDNAATTKVHPDVLEAIIPYLKSEYGNAGTIYKLGRNAANAVCKAREQVASLINAKPEQIIFTSGGTEANNMVFSGLCGYLINSNKTHIITSQIEHDSILHVVEKICKTPYVVGETCIKSPFYATYVKPTKEGEIMTEDVESEINDSTGIVSVMHTNNEVGTENNVAEIARMCRRRNVLSHTDCVQAASGSVIDVTKIDCDFISLSAHKIHGIKGVGALYIKDEHTRSIMNPLICGGNAQEFGLRGGTENVPGIVGFGKACEILKNSIEDEIQTVSKHKILFYEIICANLRKYGLESIVHVNGANPARGGKILNLRFESIDGETLLLMLDAKGICVSSGSACRSHESEPSHVLTAMGLSQDDARDSVRISFSAMNTVAEIKEAAIRFAECVNELAMLNGIVVS